MLKKKRISILMALAVCISMMSPIYANAADISDPLEEEYKFVVATPVISDGSNVSSRVDLDSNGRGYLRYNDTLDSAYAETEKASWVTATYMYAKISIGQRSLTATDYGTKTTIKTNKLYAAATEKQANSNHTITSTQNGTQYYTASYTFS